jgi:hypothetical protein
MRILGKPFDPKERFMESEGKPKTIRVESANLIGGFWFIGWLFTIAFAQLLWWQALLGILLWPYYLGLAVR